MNIPRQERHHLVRTRVGSAAGTPGQVAVDLWTSFRVRMVTLVGERVFTTMYVRSVLLARTTAPSLPPPAEDALWLQDLKASLDGLPPAQATEVSGHLLIVFTDILAVLIGEVMTMGLLSSAWGSAAATGLSRESHHE